MVADKTIRNAITIAICCSSLIASSVALTAQAAPSAASAAISEQTLLKDLGLLENRFFLRQYANDPTEKRLERLELLVFGATQDGSNQDRWERLNKSIASRGKSASTAGGGSTKSGATPSAAKPPETSSQYPVLNTLEWRALKKTFANETLDQRLARIEQKLFGQESPGIPYFDRVERLKRTLGIGVTAAAPSGPMGPAPKARPRGGSMIDDTFGFTMPPSIDGATPRFRFGTPMMPGLSDDPSMQGFNSAFAQIFEDMNRQMAELNNLNLGPGSWSLDPKTGEWIEQNTGKRKPAQGLSPRRPSARPSVPTMPQFQFRQFQQQQNDMNTLPPYADPNSI